jgi:hypothetical protein
VMRSRKESEKREGISNSVEVWASHPDRASRVAGHSCVHRGMLSRKHVVQGSAMEATGFTSGVESPSLRLVPICCALARALGIASLAMVVTR